MSTRPETNVKEEICDSPPARITSVTFPALIDSCTSDQVTTFEFDTGGFEVTGIGLAQPETMAKATSRACPRMFGA